MLNRPLNILIALDVHPHYLAAVRDATAGGIVDCIAPFPPGTALPDPQVVDRTVLFANFPPQNLAQMRQLKWFQLGSAGYEQLLGFPLREMGVSVTSGSGVNDVPIAEWCVMMMLLFERDLPDMLEMQRGRGWERKARYQSELRGRRVGILGYGNIGREVARLCHSLGLEVWTLSRGAIGPRTNRFAVPGTGDPEGVLPQRTFSLRQMDSFLPHLDYLVITLPFTPGTRNILREQELRMMRPSAVLLNPSRALLIKEEALVRALQEQWITGAALDVHYQYPLPPEHPLWSLPNVILTPHISGSADSRHYLSRLWKLFAMNLERYLQGRPLLNELALDDLG
jgi:phosphoglycerate dehydrogenase-like enzyme